MPVQLNEENGGTLININVSGKLEKADYEHFVPEFERLARQHGKLSVLFDMTGFHGWEGSAVWEDFRFGMRHLSAIKRIAMVGEKLAQRGTAIFCRPFIKAEIRCYFNHVTVVEARSWLGESEEPAGPTKRRPH